MSKAEILEEISKLSISDREEILQSLLELEQSNQIDDDLTPDEEDRLNRRLAEFDTNPTQGISWEQAREQLLERLQTLRTSKETSAS